MVVKQRYHYLAVLGFAALILLSSIDTVLKYTGIAGVAAFLILGTAAIFVLLYFIVPQFLSAISEKQAIYIALAIFAALIAIAMIGFPMANSGVFGPGGDVDDAMISAATDVVNGQYPYYKRTYLGLLISPMPGAIFFSIPFVAAGVLQLQNVFWLTVLFAAVKKQLGEYRIALGVLLTLLFYSPTLYHGIVTGSDYISNTIYVAVGMWFMLTSLSDPFSPTWKKVLFAVFLGLALSSRTNFYVSMPIFFSALIQTAGLKQSIKYLFITAVSFLAVTLPFWAYDPAGFAPLISQSSKVRELESFLPYAGILITGTGFALSIALSMQRMEKDCFVLFRNTAIVQLYILLFTSIVFALQRGQLNLYMAHAGYGMFVLFFAVLAVWITIVKRTEGSSSEKSS